MAQLDGILTNVDGIFKHLRFKFNLPKIAIHLLK